METALQVRQGMSPATMAIDFQVIIKYFVFQTINGVNLVNVMKVCLVEEKNKKTQITCSKPFTEAFCGSTPIVPNGTVSNGNNQVGSLRLIQCTVDFKIIGSAVIFCLPSGQWTHPGICRPSNTKYFHCLTRLPKMTYFRFVCFTSNSSEWNIQ